MNISGKIIFIGLGLLAIEISWNLWRKRRKEKDELHVFMFTEKGKDCREHANNPSRNSCQIVGCPVGIVRQIAGYLSGASKTLDVCMYVMTCDDLSKAIIKAHRRKARVRVIADSGMSQNPGCNDQISKFRRAGIEVRMNKLSLSNLMHHKFALVDQRVVLFGSANWTMQAFYGNNDSMIATNRPELVAAYSQEFQRLWSRFA